jgi:hypothetical protein
VNFDGTPVRGLIDWLALTGALIAAPFVLLLAVCYRIYKKVRL